MNSWILRIGKSLLVAGLLVCAVQFASAHQRSRVSGTYEVTQKTALGAQTRVRLQLHLANHGKSDLLVQRITLWDSSHPEKGGTRACAIVLRARASVGTTQEFTIPHSEFELWSRGQQPRLVLEMQSPSGGKTTEAIRLNRVSVRKAN